MEKARVYKGIEFVRISNLPKDQQDQIKNIVSPDLVIKIKTDKELLPDCIVYSDYVKWYANIYTKVSPVENGPVQPSTTKATFLSRIKHKLLPDT